MRQLTPLQLATFVSLFLCSLAVAIPTFYRNLHASRLNEPVDGLAQIGARASVLAATLPPTWAYPESVGPSPSSIPQGDEVDDPEVWAAPTWQKLGFKMERPHYYSFEFFSENGETTSTFIATAEGDLDGDGERSFFRLSGATDDQEGPRVFDLEMHREVE